MKTSVFQDDLVKSRSMNENRNRSILSLSKDVRNYAYFDRREDASSSGPVVISRLFTKLSFRAGKKIIDNEGRFGYCTSTISTAIRKGGDLMPGIQVRDGEPFESALKRFKKQCEKAGVLSEVRRREHYDKPIVKRKRKTIAARKRAIRRALKSQR